MLLIRNQRGWIAIEILLCLALLAVVLQVSQEQSVKQWHEIEMTQQIRKEEQNKANREAMAALSNNVSWLNVKAETSAYTYPNCQKCSGDNLQKWLQASQN